ncbi:hypothetical protein IV102_13090 [bacterium]|nr:hypothetical protein [bacterium]
MLNAIDQKRMPAKQSDASVQPKTQHALQEVAKSKLEEHGQENQSLPQSEQVALSKELTDDLESRGDHQGLEALLANFGSFGNQPKVDQKIDEKVKEVGGAAEIGNKPDKPKPQEVKAEWKLDTEKGNIHKGHDKIGDVSLTAKKKSPDSKEQPQSATTVAQAGHTRPGTKGAPKTDAPRPVGQVENSKVPKPDTKVGNRLFPRNTPPHDRVELSAEGRKQLQQQVGDSHPAKELRQKAQQGGQQDGDLGTAEIKTKADNSNQTAEARPAGERLDGISPDLLEAAGANQGKPDEQQKIQQTQAILK